MRIRNALMLASGVAMLAFFAMRADYFARTASQTFDEGAHLVAGVSYWRTGDFRLNPEHPPLLKLYWTIPIAFRSDVEFKPNDDDWKRKDHWRIADEFLYGGANDHFARLLAARRMNIALGVLLVFLIGWWAYRMWGNGAGLLACALAAFDPNLAAFAAIVSMDLGLALFALAAVYCLWEYTRNGSRYWFIAAGVAIGLALAAKFSAVLMVAGLGIAAVAYVLAGNALRPAEISDPRGKRLSSMVTAFVRLGLIAAAVVVVAYFGIHALDWPRGLKQQLVRGDKGDPHFFLNGEISSTGWWHYFPFAMAIKSPPGTIVLALISVAAFRFGRRFESRDLAFIVVPAAIYFAAMMASKINIGWRVILPAYPAFTLIAARSATLVPTNRIGRLIGVGVIMAAVVPGVLDLRHLGKELSYCNGVIVGRSDLHEQLGDSNIDWGQGLKSLANELRQRGDPVIYFSYAGTARPEAYGIRHDRLPSWGQFHPPPTDRVDLSGRVLVAVSVSNLQGTYLPDPTLYRWLLERDPISRTDGSIWLFDITGDPDAIDRIRSLAGRR